MWIVVVARAVFDKGRWKRWMGVAVVVESLVEGVVGVVVWVIGGGRSLGWVIGGSRVIGGSKVVEGEVEVVRICEGVVVRFCDRVVRICDELVVEGVLVVVGRGIVVVGDGSVSAGVEEGVGHGVEGEAAGG
jgi:hypothetical protein